MRIVGSMLTLCSVRVFLQTSFSAGERGGGGGVRGMLTLCSVRVFLQTNFSAGERGGGGQRYGNIMFSEFR